MNREPPIENQSTEAPIENQSTNASIENQCTDAPIENRSTDAPIGNQSGDAPAPIENHSGDAPIGNQSGDADFYEQHVCQTTNNIDGLTKTTTACQIDVHRPSLMERNNTAHTYEVLILSL